jgi:hypothetical protein
MNAFVALPEISNANPSVEIVHCVCSASYNQSERQFVFSIAPTGVAYGTTIETFLQEWSAGTLASGTPVPPPSNASPGPGVMESYVRNVCYLVLELDGSVAWQFQTDHAGISTKADYGTDNVNLVRVLKTPTGYAIDSSTSGDPANPQYSSGCVLVYFTVNTRTPVGSATACAEGFNLHVDLLQSGIGGSRSIPIVIDPDIKNDGNIPPGSNN